MLIIEGREFDANANEIIGAAGVGFVSFVLLRLRPFSSSNVFPLLIAIPLLLVHGMFAFCQLLSNQTDHNHPTPFFQTVSTFILCVSMMVSMMCVVYSHLLSTDHRPTDPTHTHPHMQTDTHKRTSYRFNNQIETITLHYLTRVERRVG